LSLKCAEAVDKPTKDIAINKVSQTIVRDGVNII